MLRTCYAAMHLDLDVRGGSGFKARTSLSLADSGSSAALHLALT